MSLDKKKCSVSKENAMVLQSSVRHNLLISGGIEGFEGNMVVVK